MQWGLGGEERNGGVNIGGRIANSNEEARKRESERGERKRDGITVGNVNGEEWNRDSELRQSMDKEARIREDPCAV